MSNAIALVIQEKIKKWKERLVAPPIKGNRLLYFKKEKQQTVEISSLESISILFEALTGKKPRPLPMADLKLQHDEADLTKSLKKLYRDASSMLEQKGVNSLFITLGTLKWSTAKKPKELLVSPILLKSVQLEKTSKRPDYTLHAADEDISLNSRLIRKLDDEGITLPKSEELENWGYKKFLDEVRNAVAERSWIVEETAYIDLFEEEKAAMIRDLEWLEQNEEMIAAHAIIQALAGNLTDYYADIPEKTDPKELDALDPQLVFQVLEADSSQQVVIEAAKAGLSFVLQGPPGTGKSQTIVNMMAELMGKGKRVLLVSEKETALEVVFDRLKKCGLGNACLKLYHKGTNSKKDLIEELIKTFNRLSQPNQLNQLQEEDAFFHQLGDCRKILNNHPACLHKKQKPLNRSAFEFYGEILKLEQAGVPTLKFNIPNINAWSFSQLSEAKNLLGSLGTIEEIFQGKRTTLWSRSRLASSPYFFDTRTYLLEEIEKLRYGIQLSKRIGERIGELFGTETPTTLADLDALVSGVTHVVKVPTVPSNWLLEIELTTLQNLFFELTLDVEKLKNMRAALEAKYNDVDQLLSLNLSGLVTRFFKYKTIFRIFRHDYRDDCKRILKYRKKKSSISYRELIDDLELAIKYNELLTKLENPTHEARCAFGQLFSTSLPALDNIEQVLNWLVGLQRYHLSRLGIAVAISSHERHRELETLLGDLQTSENCIEKGFNFLRSQFPQEVVTVHDVLRYTTSLKEVADFINIMEAELDLFENWRYCQQLVQQLESTGAKPFLSKLRESDISPEFWYSVLEKGVYENCLKYIHLNNPELENFRSNIHEHKVKEFSELDLKQYKVAQHRLRQLHAESWKKWYEQPTAKLQMRSLHAENLRKKGHKEIRQFIKSVPELVTTLKPFWVMTPLAVSQYLDPQVIDFDVVIFDEASQIRTEEAVPSIMRAKQVIIVGDNQQLPPTSFIRGTESAQKEEEEQEETYESMLDECWTFMERHILRWHYRSQDETLIAFSNQNFYDSQLISFPNPVKDDSQGVQFHYVQEGIYSRGEQQTNNIREAQEVAELALHHFMHSRHQSLGIIAFSKPQADAIREQLDQLSNKQPELHPELEEFFQENSDRFFCKSLEFVQGDERDVIILSFGYGFDSEGKLQQKFGPLIWPGGERRLNVAITRAKRKFVLVASIKAEHLKPEGKSPVVGLLKNYFTYAASHGQKLEGNRFEDEFNSDLPFEEDVYLALCDALNNQRYTVERQVGCSAYPIDLAVRDNQRDEFLMGIECDGAAYHSFPTARDRNRLRRKILEENLNWNIHRIWSSEWFHNREGQISQLVERLEHLRTQKEAKTPI